MGYAFNQALKQAWVSPSIQCKSSNTRASGCRWLSRTSNAFTPSRVRRRCWGGSSPCQVASSTGRSSRASIAGKTGRSTSSSMPSTFSALRRRSSPGAMSKYGFNKSMTGAQALGRPQRNGAGASTPSLLIRGSPPRILRRVRLPLLSKMALDGQLKLCNMHAGFTIDRRAAWAVRLKVLQPARMAPGVGTGCLLPPGAQGDRREPPRSGHPRRRVRCGVAGTANLERCRDPREKCQTDFDPGRTTR
jgi:hypothetical protein